MKLSNRNFIASAEAFERMTAHGERFTYKPKIGRGFRNIIGHADYLGGQYFYRCEANISGYDDQGQPAIFSREVTKCIDFEIERKARNLQFVGPTKGVRALLKALGAIDFVRIECAPWKLNMMTLLDALPAALGKFDLYGGTLPNFVTDKGLLGRGNVVFREAAEAQQLLERYASEWTAIEVRRKVDPQGSIRISQAGAFTYRRFGDSLADARHETQRRLGGLLNAANGGVDAS